MPFRYCAISLFRYFAISLFHYFAISLFVTSILLLSACSHKNENRIIITGQVEGASGIIYLQEQTTFELLKIDSMIADSEGRFSLDVKTDQASIYSVRLTPDDQVVFIAQPGDSVQIEGNLNQFPSQIRASGNSETDLLQDFYDFSTGNLREVDSLQRIIELNQGEENFYELTVYTDSLFNQIWVRQRLYEKEFIRNHAGDFSTLLVVNYHFGVGPVLSPKNDKEDYKRVDSGLMANYPGNRHALFFHQWLKEAR
ncbi:MAG: DUF4369 domain-containing protein [Bacteroidales bacterium]|nr:DUF4369 domain-containing protein [Bacteroidales bacterium]